MSTTTSSEHVLGNLDSVHKRASVYAGSGPSNKIIKTPKQHSAQSARRSGYKLQNRNISHPGRSNIDKDNIIDPVAYPSLQTKTSSGLDFPKERMTEETSDGSIKQKWYWTGTIKGKDGASDVNFVESDTVCVFFSIPPNWMSDFLTNLTENLCCIYAKSDRQTLQLITETSIGEIGMNEKHFVNSRGMVLLPYSCVLAKRLHMFYLYIKPAIKKKLLSITSKKVWTEADITDTYCSKVYCVRSSSTLDAHLSGGKSKKKKIITQYTHYLLFQTFVKCYVDQATLIQGKI